MKIFCRRSGRRTNVQLRDAGISQSDRIRFHRLTYFHWARENLSSHAGSTVHACKFVLSLDHIVPPTRFSFYPPISHQRERRTTCLGGDIQPVMTSQYSHLWIHDRLEVPGWGSRRRLLGSCICSDVLWRAKSGSWLVTLCLMSRTPLSDPIERSIHC